MLNPQILPPLREPEPEIPDPAIRVIDSSDTYACVALEPLARGFATTVGNPLRRLLLSSIQGAAVTWVKIEDVPHEYTVIPGIKEEVMDLLLSVKRIRIQAVSRRPGKMRLEVAGEGRVCAGDIATASDFRIVNPELHLATLDSPDVALSIEFNVEPGRGYQQVVPGEGTMGLPVGVLPVDAIYNPVRKVEYAVERMMVGQQTDWERLVLRVWTDGAVTPLDAIQEASENLVQHFHMFNQLGQSSGAPLPIGGGPIDVSPDVYLMPIERLDLSSRTLNCLKRAKLDRVGQVLEMNDDDLLNIRNFGQKSLEELHGKLAELRPGAVAATATATAMAGVSAAAGGVFRADYGDAPGDTLVFEPDDDDYDYDDDGD